MPILHLIDPKKPWIMPAPVWADVDTMTAVATVDGHRYQIGARIFPTRREGVERLLAINEKLLESKGVAWKRPKLYASAVRTKEKILQELAAYK